MCLPFRGSIKKLKPIEGSWNACDNFTGLDRTLSHVPKWRPRQRSWGRHCWARFFTLRESAFEDLSLHSFLKASDWYFEEKNGCNKHRIWLIQSLFSLFIRPKYCLENVENSISKHVIFKISWGASPQTPLGGSHLRCSKSGGVYFQSYWQHCMCGWYDSAHVIYTSLK